MVAVGDSLTAGMQDANLIGERQEFSYPALVARQAGLDFRQPLLNNQGIPPRLFLSPGTGIGQTLWRYAQVGAAALPALGALAFGCVPPEFALFPLYHAGGMGHAPKPEQAVQNLAIPGFELRELSDVGNVKELMSGMANKSEGSGKLIATGPYTRQILQDGHGHREGDSQIDKAIEQDPDLVILWAGNNDALAAAISGHIDDRSLTPMQDQTWTYHSYNPLTGKRSPHQTESIQPGFATSLVGPEGSVTRLLQETDAEIVMMNIPDVTVIPFLHETGKKVGELPFKVVLPGGVDITKKLENWVLPRAIKGEGKDGREFFPEGTQVGLPMILAKLTHYFGVKNEADVESALQAMQRNGGAFTEDEVLDPQEIDVIKERTAEFNALIEKLGQENPRIHLVDTRSLLNQAAREGIALRGEGEATTVTNTFTGLKDERGFSGIFSGDGIHPSDVGYAVVANRVLDTIRENLSDDPRFEVFAQAPQVDEKASLRNDPHQGAKPTLVLTHFVTEALQNFF